MPRKIEKAKETRAKQTMVGFYCWVGMEPLIVVGCCCFVLWSTCALCLSYLLALAVCGGGEWRVATTGDEARPAGCCLAREFVLL